MGKKKGNSHLHSNMFLLNPILIGTPPTPISRFTFQYVSIKSANKLKDHVRNEEFTFQYVSIKSAS